MGDVHDHQPDRQEGGDQLERDAQGEHIGLGCESRREAETHLGEEEGEDAGVERVTVTLFGEDSDYLAELSERVSEAARAVDIEVDICF